MNRLIISALFLVTAALVVENVEAQECVWPLGKSDVQFDGHAIEKKGKSVTFRVETIYSGSPRQNVVIREPDGHAFKVGQTYRVNAYELDDSDEFQALVCSKTVVIKPSALAVRAKSGVEKPFRRPLMDRSKALAKACDLSRLTLDWVIRPDGGFLISNVAPNVRTECVFNAVDWRKKFPRVSDKKTLHAEAAVFNDGDPVVKFDLAKGLDAKHDEPEALFQPFEMMVRARVALVTDFFGVTMQHPQSIRYLCRFRDQERALKFAKQFPNAGFDKDVFRCGLFKREFDFALKHLLLKRADSMYLFEHMMVKHFLNVLKAGEPISSDDWVEARLGYGHHVKNWGNEPVLMQLVADAFARSGEKRNAALTYWRISLLDEEKKDHWRELATSMDSEIATDPVAVEMEESRNRQQRAWVDKFNKYQIELLGVIAGNQIVETAKGLRPKRDAPTADLPEEDDSMDWFLVIGGLLAIFFVGAWFIMNKVKLD